MGRPPTARNVPLFRRKPHSPGFGAQTAVPRTPTPLPHRVQGGLFGAGRSSPVRRASTVGTTRETLDGRLQRAALISHERPRSPRAARPAVWGTANIAAASDRRESAAPQPRVQAKQTPYWRTRPVRDRPLSPTLKASSPLGADGSRQVDR
jgi:hypothetical protein